MSLSKINEFKCNECGDDDTCGDPFFTLFKCACCEKQFCSACIACIESGENPIERKRICIECYKITSVRNCNDCHKLCRCEFSTCWTCHKTDICDDCITTQYWDYREELCTECNKAYKKNEEDRRIAYQKEYAKREAEHRRNYPQFFNNSI